MVNNNTVNIIKNLQKRFEFTPDFLEFKCQRNILVFVYGTLRRGGKDNHILDDSVYLGTAHTLRNIFTIKSYFSMPVVFEEEKISSNHIVGEVYAVSPITLADIDHVMHNTGYTDRKIVWVELRNQPSTKNTDIFQGVLMHTGSLPPAHYQRTNTYSEIKERKQYQEWRTIK